ncbi:bifunctional 2-C-methyl-D-erythritol 4-phosphate cytidylyltransferase/2-C-methyl-D-erythritol 2,4-cyclodiphosphate synthase [Actibacterium ureilyticum]|uniref:bifunctional 2-C-methyl-D-erythritol 4-phosphate cytidylyltransferase/2-C-methyl-D-erythritol 2,4-cyclodiphosphate synthase n=1 Tax=Actibacterium ureilyticum TaxID=1590614 RepID=UPI000BAAF95A|nr:bifunctional 2-C-methyl-D-erythritol 4-phosphate cytidylyltransferase/2-C-methyl-D-erythritol 2,4-cyclodiphosphate synthase [Actibacterium ureilyticum]
MTTAAIIVAAGRGTRAGGAIPKQFQPLLGTSVLQRSADAMLSHPRIDTVVVVIHPQDAALFASACPDLDRRVTLTTGADSRDGSVRAGLAALPEGCDRVLIHDGARPLVSAALIDAVLAGLADHDGAAPALAVTDALWRGAGGRVTGMQPRDGLYRAQTPQGFHLNAIRAAHEAHPGGAADDVEVALAAGLDVAVVEGEEQNIKLTHPQDFDRAARLLQKNGDNVDIRTGNGFDVHAFGDGDHVTLCGVQIPHARGLKGHSDADVGMHALTDALYGALALGDIGRHFPPSDPQWKGADSRIFLDHAAACARDRGYAISNADVTLICEQPKIGPHAVEMAAVLAGICGIDADRVSVKATTSERLGFTGREEGIAAIATVTLVSA